MRVQASWQARLVARVVRWRVKPRLAHMADIAAVREVFNAPLPFNTRGVRFRDEVLGGVRGEWVEPEAAAGAPPPADVLLYLHGGGFIGCSPLTHRPITVGYARRGFRVFVPDYRLAPEHPFPAAPDDALGVFRALRERQRLEQARSNATRGRLCVAGDSAGGNLTMSLLLSLKEAGEAQPDAAALFSPVVSLTGDHASLTLNTPRDPMFTGPELAHLGEAYLQGADATHWRASPLQGALEGLPPLIIHVGASEVLRDDSLHLARKASEAGVQVELKVFDTAPHDWPLLERLPEARRSLDDTARFMHEARARSGPEELDVFILGAGLSGIGAAVHLQQHQPGLSFGLFEARQAIGGTWDLFRYPGVRSDSDMYTLGYHFKPWRDGKAIAEGPVIRSYIQQVADEHGIAPRVRYGHRVVAAEWQGAEARWRLTVMREGHAQPTIVHARFLLACGGYYSYTRGHRPAFPGESLFKGPIVHPQFWPEGLHVQGQRIVVIGSGATAVTLVPALAASGARVTMLQRSPSYVFARPEVDPVAEFFKRRLPATWAYRLTRLKNVAMQLYFFRLARKYPEKAKARLVNLVREQLPAGYDVERHFTPRYNPWDQRVCLVPDGDLFACIRAGTARVVTDTIERFTEHGIQLASGEALAADVIVTATGLELNVLGDLKVSVDGEPVDFSRAIVYKGLMYSGVPNLVSTFGYTNASWTLKADLTAQFTCRLLAHMATHGHHTCVPRPPPGMAGEPFLDFTSGYVQRATAMLPKQGPAKPWRLNQNYLTDWMALRWGRIDDGVLAFSGNSAQSSSWPAGRRARGVPRPTWPDKS